MNFEALPIGTLDLLNRLGYTLDRDAFKWQPESSSPQSPVGSLPVDEAMAAIEEGDVTKLHGPVDDLARLKEMVDGILSGAEPEKKSEKIEMDPRSAEMLSGLKKNFEAARDELLMFCHPERYVDLSEFDVAPKTYDFEEGVGNMWKDYAEKMLTGFSPEAVSFYASGDVYRDRFPSYGIADDGRVTKLQELADEKKIEKAEEFTAYGWCPFCAQPGRSRERRPNGNDRCVNEHTYPSKAALTTAPYDDAETMTAFDKKYRRLEAIMIHDRGFE